MSKGRFLLLVFEMLSLFKSVNLYFLRFWWSEHFFFNLINESGSTPNDPIILPNNKLFRDLINCIGEITESRLKVRCTLYIKNIVKILIFITLSLKINLFPFFGVVFYSWKIFFLSLLSVCTVHCAVLCALFSTVFTEQYCIHWVVFCALCSAVCTVQYCFHWAILYSLGSVLCTVQCCVHCSVLFSLSNTVFTG